MPSHSCSVFTWFTVGLEANLRRIWNVSFKVKGVTFSSQKNNINRCIRGTGVKKEEFHSSASLSKCFKISPGDEGKINKYNITFVKMVETKKERKHTLLLSPRSAKMNCSRPGSGNSFCNCSTAPKLPRDRLSCGHNPFNCQKCFFIPMLKTTKCTPLCTWFCQEDAAKNAWLFSMSSKSSSTAMDHQICNFVREVNLEKYV